MVENLVGWLVDCVRRFVTTIMIIVTNVLCGERQLYVRKLASASLIECDGSSWNLCNGCFVSRFVVDNYIQILNCQLMARSVQFSVAFC